MPEQYLTKWIHHVKPRWKTAFLSAMIIGFFTHMYIFTNAIPNHDSLVNIYTPQFNFNLGRFYLSPFSGISSYFDLPWINGLLSILYLAVFSVLIAELLEMKKTLSIVLTSGLIVTFPAISAIFSYMFTADGYMAGFLLTASALLLTKKYKYGFLPGGLLFYFAVGIYQVNLPLLLTLTTLFLISEILYRQIALRKFFTYALRFFALTAIGMALYTITFTLYRNFFAGQLRNYQGLNEVGSAFSLWEPIIRVRNAFSYFFFRGFGSDMPVNLFEIANVAVFLLILVGFVLVIVRGRQAYSTPMLVIAVVLVLTLPFTAYSLYFVSPGVNYHMLMMLPLVPFYLLPILFYDNFITANKKTSLFSWATVLVSALIVFNFALIANISYFNMNLKYEKSTAAVNRIVDRVEQTAGFEQASKLAVFGELAMESKMAAEYVPENIPRMTGALGETFLKFPSHYQYMMENMYGLSYDLVTAEEYQSILASSVYQDMESWPATDSVRIINDTLIIKLSEEVR
ncbi:glucosyltransferase domain-containing protein [Planococcus shixiaomingii]|uniref:glucosyltransferase domain-containing protein n=1 Tax=Planococcus shixiaomingii TaxID=3058393 RepID=UPI0026023826|nr:glucosyltransferase domain-containing protein [Planococcus sp. N022]WKA55714.1 glucosyltransferase domain-containing protein [Planococcus sp. N022]